MVRCRVLTEFSYSPNGIKSFLASAGDDILIPDALVAGLTDGGYIRIFDHGKAIAAAPENKMMQVPDNKSVEVKRGRGRPKKAR